MDWSNEVYVRLYVRNTTTWELLGFEGQTVLMHLMRRLDRSGVMDLEGLEPWEAAILHCRIPDAIARIGTSRLLERGVLLHAGNRLCMPNFKDAQEATKSDRQRARESRERRRIDTMTPTDPNRPVTDRDIPDVTNRDGAVTNRDVSSRNGTPASHAVTRGHGASHAVTLTSALLCSALPCVAEEEPAATAPVIPIDEYAGRERADAIRGARWCSEVCQLEHWSPLGKLAPFFAELARKPENEKRIAAAVLLAEGRRTAAVRRILKPDHIVTYWPDYSQGRVPGRHEAVGVSESPGAARIRKVREACAAEVAARRAGSPEGLAYDLDIMRAEHDMRINGVIAAVDREGSRRGGDPSRVSFG